MDKSFTSLICKKGPSRVECARFIERFRTIVLMNAETDTDKANYEMNNKSDVKYEDAWNVDQDQIRVKATKSVTRKCNQFRITIGDDYVITINTGKNTMDRVRDIQHREVSDNVVTSIESNIGQQKPASNGQTRSSCYGSVCKGSVVIDDTVPSNESNERDKSVKGVVVAEPEITRVSLTDRVTETIQIIVKPQQISENGISENERMEKYSEEISSTPENVSKVGEVSKIRMSNIGDDVKEMDREKVIESFQVRDIAKTKPPSYSTRSSQTPVQSKTLSIENREMVISPASPPHQVPSPPQLGSLTSKVIEFIKLVKTSQTCSQFVNNEIIEPVQRGPATTNRTPPYFAPHKRNNKILENIPDFPEEYIQSPPQLTDSNHSSRTIVPDLSNKENAEKTNESEVSRLETANTETNETIESITFPEKEHSLLNNKMRSEARLNNGEEKTDLSETTEITDNIESKPLQTSYPTVSVENSSQEQGQGKILRSNEGIVAQEKIPLPVLKEIFKNSSVNTRTSSPKSSKPSVSKRSTVHSSDDRIQMEMLADVRSESLCRILSAVLEELGTMHGFSEHDDMAKLEILSNETSTSSTSTLSKVIDDSIVVMSDNYYIVNIEQLRSIGGIMDRLDKVLNELIKHHNIEVSRSKHIDTLNVGGHTALNPSSIDTTSPLSSQASSEPSRAVPLSTINVHTQMNNEDSRATPVHSNQTTEMDSQTTDTVSSGRGSSRQTSGRKARFQAFRNSVHHRDAINTADELLDLLTDVEKLLINNCADRYEMMLLLEQILSDYSKSARKAVADLKKFIVTFNKNNSYL